MYEWYSYILPSLSEAEVNGNLRLIKMYIPSFFMFSCIFVFFICTFASNCICIQSRACLFPGRPMMSLIPPYPVMPYQPPPACRACSRRIIKREWWPSSPMWISVAPPSTVYLYLYCSICACHCICIGGHLQQCELKKPLQMKNKCNTMER